MENVLFNDLIDRVVSNNIPVLTDSRLVKAGDIFVSLPLQSREFDMMKRQIEYMGFAAEKNASVLLCHKDIAKLFAKTYPQYRHLLLAVEDERAALGILGQAIYQTHKVSFPLIGITGTNGKTTLTYLAEYFFKAMGKKSGVVGTVSYRYPGFEMDAPLTTPDCLFLHSFFRKMEEVGTDYGVMEVSSHAIDQNRIAGLNFDCAIFTNLTQDHLDYHAHMEDYFSSKAKLFYSVPHKDKKCIINGDSDYGQRLLEKLPNAIVYTLFKPQTSLRTLKGTMIAATPEGLELKMSWEDEDFVLKTPLIGQHNASNLLAIVAMGLAYGFKLSDFACFENFNGVSGRLERVENDKNIHVFVDYAHTPDALINVLLALRTAGFEYVITLFGCGGDRDKTKRPKMAEAVSEYSDVTILTSDNPRTEDPEAILDDVEKGIDMSKTFYRLADRKEALHFAVQLAESSPNRDKTALLVAGKGHETYQIIGKTKYPFSDQLIIKEALQ